MDEFEAILRDGNAQAILKHIRQYKLRASHEVLQYGRDYVLRGGGRLGDEAWSVYEQVFQAALDVGDTKLAETALQPLQKKFPGSVRVDKLRGMKAEAEGDFDKATAIYSQIMEANPVNAMVWKRLVSVAKASGDMTEAIRRLNEYLKVFQSDTAAWQELADLYLQKENPGMAAFCYEELIMFSPANFAFHTSLAEIYYTMGGMDHLRLSRKHYAQSLELHGDYLRALYGMCATCYAIATSAKQDKGDGPVNTALFKLAAERIKAHYSKVNPGMLPIVEGALNVQQKAINE